MMGGSIGRPKRYLCFCVLVILPFLIARFHFDSGSKLSLSNCILNIVNSLRLNVSFLLQIFSCCKCDENKPREKLFTLPPGSGPRVGEGTAGRQTPCTGCTNSRQ